LFGSTDAARSSSRNASSLLPLIKKDQCAVITDDDERSRIEMHQSVVTAQRAIVFAVQPMQRRLTKYTTASFRCLAPHPGHFIARFFVSVRARAKQTISIRASMMFGLK